MPRFRPGDKVWTIESNKLVELEICSIEWDAEKVKYYLGRCARDSWSVFATREELIESL